MRILGFWFGIDCSGSVWWTALFIYNFLFPSLLCPLIWGLCDLPWPCWSRSFKYVVTLCFFHLPWAFAFCHENIMPRQRLLFQLESQNDPRMRRHMKLIRAQYPWYMYKTHGGYIWRFLFSLFPSVENCLSLMRVDLCSPRHRGLDH